MWEEIFLHAFTKVGCTFSEELICFDPVLWRATIHRLYLEPYSGGLFSYAPVDICVYLASVDVSGRAPGDLGSWRTPGQE